MDKSNKNPFLSDPGHRVYKKAEQAISDFSMDAMLKRGVLVGLSGGADSVMLLYFLIEYRKNNYDFPIVAFHLNHMIRGAEADADEAFARAFSSSLGIPFISASHNIPKIAKEKRIGLEEAARNARYSAFREIIRGRDDIAAIAVAHNATDNLETIIFNMMRGTGSAGMVGIAAVRDDIIRPLIYSSSAEIRQALELAGVEYVTDATNNDTEYTRNYIRHTVLPTLRGITDSPEDMGTRVSSNIRCDNSYINSVADSFYDGSTEGVERKALAKLHKAVFARVIRNMAVRKTDKHPEAIHIEKIYSLIQEDNFSVSLPGSVSFICERGYCRIAASANDIPFCYDVTLGENDYPNFAAKLLVNREKPTKSSLNVYNFSIQLALPSAIIKDGLYIRNKRDGDTYRMGGMTRKVKRMFCDANIPAGVRSKIPLLCDKNGILWIPGFPSRDVGVSDSGEYIYFTFVITDTDSDTRFRFANEWKNKGKC